MSTSVSRGIEKSPARSQDERIRDMRIRQLQQNYLFPIAANVILALAVAYYLRSMIAPAIVISWLVVVLVLNGGRYLYLRRQLGTTLTSAQLARWAWIVTIGVGLTGAVWGAGAILFYVPDSPHLQVFMAFVIGGMAAGAVVSYAAWLPAFFAYAVLSMVPLIVRFLIEPGDLTLVMGGMLLLYLMFMVALAKSFNDSTKQLIELRGEASRLQDERNVSEEFLAKAFHSSPALMAISEPVEGMYFDVNDTWSAITGYSHQEAMAASAVELGVWARSGDRERFIKEASENGSVRGLETVFRTKQGEELDLLASGEIIDMGTERRLLFIGQDITRLKEVERLKSEFVAIVSHELRTPLTSIKGALGLILGGTTGTIGDKSRDLLLLAEKNTFRLAGLVDDILDFEKLRSGEISFELQTCDLGDLVNDTVLQCGPYASRFEVTFQIAKLSSNTLVQVDPVRISQVLINLLSNAAKFSPTGGVVTISLSAAPDRVRVEVKDQGVGIKPAFHDKVFERFSQQDASDTRSVGGSGLGLSISKSIIEGHSGTIGFDSAEGAGTTFYFELPAVARH